MKRIIQIVLFVIFAMAVSGLMGFIYLENGKQQINEIIVRVDRKTEKGFVSAETIRMNIENIDSLMSRQINEISIDDIEGFLNNNVYVEKADAYINIDKNLIVNIRERNPILRVYSKKNEGFYLDENGNMLPLSPKYTARVLVANGYINAGFNKAFPNIFDTINKSSQLTDLFKITWLIRENTFLNAQISQLYVNSKLEYDLIPELGDQVIQFGKADNTRKKLDKLELWYKNAFVKEDGDKYKFINLKYKDQVVCTKK